MNREHLLHVRQLLKPLGHNSLHCLKEIQSSNLPYLLKFLINIYQVRYHRNYLTLSRRSPLSYRNQSIDLGSKSKDWFLYDNGLRLERVKHSFQDLNSIFRCSTDVESCLHFFLHCPLSQNERLILLSIVENIDSKLLDYSDLR